MDFVSVHVICCAIFNLEVCHEDLWNYLGRSLDGNVNACETMSAMSPIGSVEELLFSGVDASSECGDENSARK